MFCITLDKEGKEAFREQKPKRYRPRNGFEKRKDGNFYKQLGDPRCITDVEKKRALLEEAARRTDPLIVRNSPAPREQGSTILLKVPDKKINLTVFLSRIKWETKAYATNGTDFTFGDARIQTMIGVPEVDMLPKIKKIQILASHNTIRFWKTYETGEPDYILIGAIDETNSN